MRLVLTCFIDTEVSENEVECAPCHRANNAGIRIKVPESRSEY